LLKEFLMRRLLASLAFSVLSLAVIAAPARACINDRDTRASEREFKSQYRESPGTDSLSPGGAPVSSPEVWVPLAAAVAGVTLLISALGITLWRTGPRN
jgi:hypothetical protein